MISFMVLGGPRSASTWMANLLTTDSTLCLHDPLLEHKAAELDMMQIPDMRIGIADTSALLWPDWVWAHSARKVVLWRDPKEMNVALRTLGLREINPESFTKWIKAAPVGVKVYPWQSVFCAPVAAEICRKLDVPFNRWRFQELVKMNVQPQFSRIPVGREAAQELVRRLAKEIE